MDSKTGHIVILSNPSLKGLLMITHTLGSAEEMLRKLNTSTDLPMPFNLEKSFLIHDPEAALRKVFRTLADFRVSGQKNYFDVEIEQVVNAISELCERIGYVYILSNPSFKEGLLKIGVTKKTLAERIAQLNEADSVPAPFKIEAYFEVTETEVFENRIQHALGQYRISDKKFYNLNSRQAITKVSEICRAEPKGAGIHEIVEDQEILELDRIIKRCDRAIEESREDRDALLERGRAYAKLYSHEKAASDLEAVIALNPDDKVACVARIERGRIYHGRGEYEMAIREFSRAMDLDPDNEWACVALFTRGQSYQALGDYGKAIQDYDKTIGLKPDDEWICVAHIERGKAYFNLGDYQRAIDDYDKAIALNPEDEWASVAYVERGQVYYCLGDYEKAINDYDKTLALKPESR